MAGELHFSLTFLTFTDKLKRQRKRFVDFVHGKWRFAVSALFHVGVGFPFLAGVADVVGGRFAGAALLSAAGVVGAYKTVLDVVLVLLSKEKKLIYFSYIFYFIYYIYYE